MAVPLLINGITYQYPELDDEGWGNAATNWAVAITQGTLQKSGGLFSLISGVDFGPSFGLKSIYFQSRSSNIALTGVFRLSNTDAITFRNASNTADLAFGTGSSDAVPSYNGIDLVNLSTAQTLSNKTISSSIFTGNTFNNPTINTPTVSGGTFTGPSVTGGTFTNPTINTPTVTNGSFSSPAINGGTLSSISISGATALFNNGTVTAPSISFVSSPSTGMYSPSTNQLAFSTNGNLAGFFDNSGTPNFTVAGNISTTSGSLVAANLLSPGSTLTLKSNGLTALSFDGTPNATFTGTVTATSFIGPFTGQGYFPNGSASAPSISFINDHTTGIYFSAPHTLAFSTNGTNAGSIDQNGAWTIGAPGNGQTHVVNGYGLTLTTANPSPVGFEVSNTNATGVYNATLQMATTSGGGSPIVYWNQYLTQFAMGVYYGDGLLRIETGTNAFGSGSNVIAAKIDTNGTWIIGPVGSTHTHIINGNLSVTGSNTSSSFIPTSSTIPTNGMYLSSGGFLAFASNGILAGSFDHSGTPNFTVPGNITSTSGSISAAGISSTGSSLILKSNGLTALSFDGTPNALFAGNVGIQSDNSLELFDSGNINYIGIKAPTSVPSTYTITLPSTSPATNTSLTYNGTNYVWATAGGSSLTSVTLNDNTSNGTVATFVSATTNVVFIQYSLKRGTNFQVGELKIVNDGTSPQIIDANKDIGDCGTTFSVSISGSNLLLQYTTTSTGTAVSMKYLPVSWAA